MCGCESCEIVFASRSNADALGESGQVLLQDFDGDDAVEPRVPRLVHLTRSART
jgi:hypothetical protein